LATKIVRRVGGAPDVIHLSIGLESEDLIRDLDEALTV
jgi:O-acetylhomoserine/O-acetylserine sulfhydrylase-like pyridoxal-dependent enzyme